MFTYNIEYFIFAVIVITIIIAGLNYLFIKTWQIREERKRQRHWDRIEQQMMDRVEQDAKIIASLYRKVRNIEEIKNQGMVAKPSDTISRPSSPTSHQHKAPTHQSSPRSNEVAPSPIRPRDYTDDDSVALYRQPSSVMHSPVHHDTDRNDTPSFRQCDEPQPARSSDYDSSSSDSSSSDSSSSSSSSCD